MTRKSFQPQFVPLILAGTKIHTIRATPKRLPKIGEDFVGFIWTGKPYRSPQQEFFRSTVARIRSVGIQNGWIWIDDVRLKTRREADLLALHDGFVDWDSMREWFHEHHGFQFTGILIEWAQPITPLGALGVLAVQPAAESRP